MFQDGTFLVRDSSRKTVTHPYVLMVLYRDKVYNIQIRYQEQEHLYLLGTSLKGKEVFCGFHTPSLHCRHLLPHSSVSGDCSPGVEFCWLSQSYIENIVIARGRIRLCCLHSGNDGLAFEHSHEKSTCLVRECLFTTEIPEKGSAGLRANPHLPSLQLCSQTGGSRPACRTVWICWHQTDWSAHSWQFWLRHNLWTDQPPLNSQSSHQAQWQQHVLDRPRL